MLSSNPMHLVSRRNEFALGTFPYGLIASNTRLTDQSADGYLTKILETTFGELNVDLKPNALAEAH